MKQKYTKPEIHSEELIKADVLLVSYPNNGYVETPIQTNDPFDLYDLSW